MRPAGLLLCCALFVGAGCAEQEAPAQPQLVDWSGRDGRALPLDQPIRLEFDRALAAPVRIGAVQLIDSAGDAVEGLRLEATGRFLSLSPRVPLQADLRDGSLQPDSVYRLHLHGAPRLDALHTIDGGVLVGDRGVEVQTLPVDDPEALLGFGGSLEPLRIQGMMPGATWRADGGSAVHKLRFSIGIDPRTLAPARLLGPDGAEIRSCELELLVPEEGITTLAVDFGDWKGWGVLELPPLEGLGGAPLAEGQRSLRVHRTP